MNEWAYSKNVNVLWVSKPLFMGMYDMSIVFKVLMDIGGIFMAFTKL